MSYDYRDKVMVVTGGAGDIAAALIGPAARRGARIAVVDIRGEEARRVAAALPGSGHRGHAVDLTDLGQVEALVARLEEDHGRIDVLVNNVGMSSQERFDERDVASIRRELEVNLVSPLVLTRLAVPLLRAARDPRVITTVSLGGIFPLGETPIYTASKFGLRGAMLAIGLDLAAKGITVSSVLPSATDTRMLRQEAVEGGNALQFQDPPQPPEAVARAMMALLDRPRLEAYPKASESLLVRLAMLVPNQLPRLMRLFRRKGERGMAAYLRRLEAEGRAVRGPDGWQLVE
ncbi:SDR family oxidoreductase [Tessaracoccus rhinocerotis]|uniref:SDR family oxidoreductase n=1 Tax=Tessaracoccus rhinocerotis TaxID=1689449 RepID=A0A553K5P5_9ACTN|nr:SDR family oxidoreductase [Tessaracoccus rhinocerotis]TRY20028.1 SDR family oxidoreductase [Tessaracoccus rhinocerotis]